MASSSSSSTARSTTTASCARSSKRGRPFRTQSDTEVLLQLYDEGRGDACSCAACSRSRCGTARGGVLLARDPYGIKPLYYADDGGTMRIASQVRRCCERAACRRAFDPAGAAGFFLRGTVPEPFTMYRAIRALPAGRSLCVDAHGVREPQQYFSIADAARCASIRRGLHRGQRSSIVHDAVLESVRVSHGGRRPGRRVPLRRHRLHRRRGAGARDRRRDLQTMTLRFEEYRGRVNDEAPLAALVARLRRGANRSRS